MSEGQSCTYTCRDGYQPVTTTGGTVTCNAGGVMTGGMVCLTIPPTVLPQNFSVREKSPATTAVGQVVARASAPEQELDFTIMSVTPRIANETFSIGSCSGMILVRDPTLLVFRQRQNFTLNIRVRPDLAEASATRQNITVFLINVDDPPVFTPDVQALNISENAVSAVGPVVVWDEDDDVLAYSILLGNDAGNFRIDNRTGVLYAAQPLDFEAQATWSLLVQARELTFDKLISTGTVMVTVLDANDPPIVSSLVVELDESVAGLHPQGLGQVVAFDPDNNLNYPEWSQLSFNITGNAYNRSQPLFGLDAGTGAVSLQAPLIYSYDDGEDGVVWARTVPTQLHAAAPQVAP